MKISYLRLNIISIIPYSNLLIIYLFMLFANTNLPFALNDVSEI